MNLAIWRKREIHSVLVLGTHSLLWKRIKMSPRLHLFLAVFSFTALSSLSHFVVCLFSLIISILLPLSLQPVIWSFAGFLWAVFDHGDYVLPAEDKP